MIKNLRPGIWWNGVFDRDLRTFDIIMSTEFGTTYNAYTVKGSKKTALIETTKQEFENQYFEGLNEILGDCTVDYVIANHTEPDHSGSLRRLINKYPDIVVYGSASAITFLKEIINQPFNSHVVKDGEILSLGDKTLQFISAPNLHWPDSMYTYIREEQLLFTCDSFGAHYGAEGILRSEIQNNADYLNAAKYYFDMILSPFKSFMLKALDKIKDLPVDMICTGHGPILDSNILDFIELYREWSVAKSLTDEKTAVIAYVSSYGYTKTMACNIQKGMESAGIKVKCYNLVEDDTSTLSQDLLDADAILLGSPTILSDALKPIYDLSTTMLPITHGKKHAAAFGSYGWTGEAVPNLTERLRQLKMNVTDGLRIRFNPSEDDCANCKIFGRAFGEKILETHV